MDCGIEDLQFSSYGLLYILYESAAWQAGDAVLITSLAGKVAVVTGAGRGIGRAHALHLAARGASVIVNDPGLALDGSGFDSAPAEEVVEAIRRNGGQAFADTTNVGSLAGGAALVEDAIAKAGRIDILVNNAGIGGGGGDIAHPDEAGLDRLLGVHFKGPLGAMSAALRDMAGRGWGRIVNTVSEVALDARFGAGLGYGAAKAAIWSATLTAAREGAAHGVTVNAISPGARTRMNASLLDAGFRGQAPNIELSPDHVARVAGWLCTDEAGDVTGRIVHAAGGQVREYATTRSGRTELAQRLEAAMQALGA
jgi:NAD(P)-dependent dehydrogenase (short-subunit alcohol dehydrogenase family)